MTYNNNIASNELPHTLTDMKQLQCGNLMKFCPNLRPVNQKIEPPHMLVSAL